MTDARPQTTILAGSAEPLMRGPSAKGISSEFSLYLDVVRFVAACLVVIYHSNMRGIVRESLPLSDYGHSSVIVFFVLSGYVIAYITDTKENTIRAYATSRISRIYSLALPAVLLTPMLDVIGQGLLPAIYDGKTTDGHALVRVLSSLAFTNEVWFVSIMSFSNVPYGSLCFEVWYYVLFAVFASLPGESDGVSQRCCCWGLARRSRCSFRCGCWVCSSITGGLATGFLRSSDGCWWWHRRSRLSLSTATR